MAEKRILIASANAGAGHVKAAQAVHRAFRDMDSPGIQVRSIDTLEYSSAFLRKAYPATYIFTVKRMPVFWGMAYYVTDNPVIYNTIVAPLRRFHNARHCRGLEAFLRDYNPDVVINTHFLGSEVMADMKRRGLLPSCTLLSVVTDCMMHSFWLDPDIDCYCVASEQSKRDLVKRGIPQSRVSVTGIPVDAAFARQEDTARIRHTLGIESGRKTVLVASGGFGVGPVRELVRALAGLSGGIQLLVVCGKNDSLYGTMRKLSLELSVPVKVFGFVNNMHELMSVSDIIVTKSGGMTSSEALAKGLPMIITSAIPGQEARNCRFLVQAGAAVRAQTPCAVKRVVAELLDSEEKMRAMKRAIDTVKKPLAARAVAECALNLYAGRK